MRSDEVTAIILCGGSGVRLGGADKPMKPIQGRRLVDYVIDALRPQVGTIVISCGRDGAAYRELGYPAIADDRPGEGPLGGIVSALAHVETDWVLTYPGDAPFADASLVSRLVEAAEATGVAVPRAGDRRQNLILLLSRPKADALARFYRQGGRAARDWLDDQGAEGVDMTDIADSFFNVNTTADLAACEQRLSSPR